jgi:hypothetical protein
VADAAWRLRAEDVVPALQRFLSDARSDIRRAAVLALLCLAPARMAAFARSRIEANVEFEGALATCVGIAGQLADSGLLMGRVEANPTDTSAVAALGILGAPASVPFLLGLLASDNDPVKLAAAGALDLMSGHHARERVTQTIPPDPGDESTAGEVREVERVNTSPEYWSQWWHRERSRLEVNARWRRGGFFSLGACIAELADAQSTLIDRARAYLELSARAPATIAFEPDWFVGRQDESIDAWTAWWERARQTST